MREIRTVTFLNLGDNIYNVFLLRKIVDLYKRQIKFTHYLHSKYIPELNNFIRGYEDNIIFKDIINYTQSEVIPIEDAQIPGWFCTYDRLVRYHRENKNLAILLYADQAHWAKNHPGTPNIVDSCFFDEVIYRGYIQYCEFMEVDCPLSGPVDTLLDLEEFLTPNKLTDNYDLFIANNRPMSNQWNPETKVFDYLLERIDLTKIKVISLEPTGYKEIPSTIESGLNLIEVGNIAINSKRIIGVHSSPYTTLINKFNHESVEEFVVFQNWEQRFRYRSGNSINFRSDEEFMNNYKIPLHWCKI
jgi:hypothetical protein